MVRAVLLIALAFFTVSCASFPGQKEKSPRHQVLQMRVNSYFDTFALERYEALWYFLSAGLQRTNISEANYAFNMRHKLSDVEADHINSEILIIKGDLGATKSYLNLKKKGSAEFTEKECFKVLWIWDEINWYVAKTYLCETDLVGAIKKYKNQE